MLMKVGARLKQSLLVLGMFALSFAQAAPAVAVPSVLDPKKEEYTFYYPADKDTQSKIKTALKDKKRDDPALQNLQVFSRGGIFTKLGGVVSFKYKGNQGGGNNSGENYLFEATYNCNENGVGSGDDYTATLQVQGLKDNYQSATIKGDIYLTKIQKRSNSKISKDLAREDGVLPEDMNSAGVPQGCRPNLTSVMDRPGAELTLSTYQNLPAAAKAKWPGVDGIAAANSPDPGPTASNEDAETTCQKESFGFGWFICGALKATETTVTSIEQSFIQPFLDTDPLNLTCTDQQEKENINGCGMHAIWESIRNVANVFFVLIFLVFVFANTLSINLNAYAVKTMLPRIIIAAILVQFSYLLMAIAIDVTNVLGGGLLDLVESLVPITPAGGTGNRAAQAGILGAGALIGTILASGAIFAALTSGVVLIFIGSALLGMLGVFLTLIFRQILIVLLIIVSPVAIACMVLPNTQKFFKAWQSNLVRVLLMYPMIVMLFAAGKIFSAAAGATQGVGELNLIFQLVALIAPLFLIPATFKAAGGLMSFGTGLIAGQVTGRAQKALGNSDAAKAAQQRQGAIRRGISRGEGVPVFGRNVGSDRSKIGGSWAAINRVAALDRSGARARARMDGDRKIFDNEFDNANFDGSQLDMVIGGRAHRDARLRALSTERTAVMADATLSAVDRADKLKAIDDNVESVKQHYQDTRRYHGNAIAAQAAAMRIADKGAVTDATRTNLAAILGPDKGKDVWKEMGFKAGEKQLHLQATKFDSGEVEADDLKKIIDRTDAKKLAGQKADFWRVVAHAEQKKGPGSVLDPALKTNLTTPGTPGPKLTGEASNLLSLSNHTPGAAMHDELKNYGGKKSNARIEIV